MLYSKQAGRYVNLQGQFEVDVVKVKILQGMLINNNLLRVKCIESKFVITVNKQIVKFIIVVI